MTDLPARLDLRGLKCPLPALIAKRAALRAPKGTLLEIFADDPLAELDLTYMCEREGIAVLSSSRERGVFHMLIRRA